MTGSNSLHDAALRIASLVARQEKPTSFRRRLDYELELAEIEDSSSSFLPLLRGLSDNDPLLDELGRALHKWDAATELDKVDWIGETEPSTDRRRALVCRLLELNDEESKELLRRRPIFRSGATVITAPWDRWYSTEVAAKRDFYWRHYRRYLLETKGWPTESVSSVDVATSRVLERLTDPTRPEAYQSKGLVVGYVQSGKTANFTGVIAKAIDAGYRLVIVMTGTLELLRGQTQRRIDMEMIGKKNIVGDLPEEQRPDYQQDSDWEKFTTFDRTPSTGIQRLTEHSKDYRRGQFERLRFDRPIQAKPLFDPDNLFPIDARLAVVKKNKAVLNHLVRDIKANKSAFAEIPVLIIDDESDQASVNTVNPATIARAEREGQEVQTRKAINHCIAQMLELMPRAQYVGYTATPFANVFTDPSDEQGIFPKDFVIGLDRPPGYMGVEDFHDLDGVPSSGISNEEAYVRKLEASHEPEAEDARATELAQAIDSFVLAGAVKLWRESRGMKPFRHHTMLIHESVRTRDHAALADLVRETWSKGEYTTPGGASRLRKLYEEDVLRVSKERLEERVLMPPAWDDLRSWVGAAVARITEFQGNPVLVVNSDRDIEQQELNFDEQSVWRILVGGAKLSRGFTVEGLTVTYFRRATNMSDSLTQMGRWFGFRYGYRDLVRLYIAEAVRAGQRRVSLYEAFEGIAHAENDFRAQLKKYARWRDGKPLVTPMQIPPLVRQHLPWLQPTARNKMFNARLVREVGQPFQPVGLGLGKQACDRNLELWQPLLSAAQTAVELPLESGGTFEAVVGVVAAPQFVEMLENLRYVDGYEETTVRPAMTAYQEAIDAGQLKSFMLILPQPGKARVEVPGVGPRAVVRRRRRRGEMFGEVTDKKHRMVAKDFAASRPAGPLASLHGPDVGAVLVYLMDDEDDQGRTRARSSMPEGGLVVGLSAYVPELVARGPSMVPTFSVHSPEQGDEVTVDAPVDGE